MTGSITDERKTMTMFRRKAVFGLVLVLALVGASCGDDDGSSDTTAAPLATEAPTTQAPPATEAPATTAAAAFDMQAAVYEYTSTIPDGFMAVGDLTAFKDQVEASGALLIDVREVGEYEEGHLEGAVNIPLRTIAQNLDQIPTDRQVFVYCKSGHRAGIATSALRMMGYDNVLGYPPGWDGWTAAGEPVSTEAVQGETYPVPEIAPEMLEAVDTFLSTIPEGFYSAGNVEKVQEGIDAGAFMLDVRTAGEYVEGYIPGATNIDLRELPLGIDRIPTDTQVTSYCRSGWRAALSLPVLHVLARDNSRSFPGSWAAWTDANQPVEVP